MEVEKVRLVLKQQLSRRDITYADAAKVMKISLPTLKRWMTHADLTMEAVDSLLDLLKISWTDFLKLIEEAEVSRSTLTEKQEMFLSKNPKACYVFIQLFIGKEVKEVMKELSIDHADMLKYLSLLVKVDLIEYSENSQLRILTRGPFKWKRNQPFSKAYFEEAAHNAFVHFMKNHHGLDVTFHPQNDLVRLNEMYLSQKSLTRFKADLWEIIERYHETGRQELRYLSLKEMKPVTTLLMNGEFNVWKSVHWDK